MIFPLDLRFKLLAIAGQISVREPNGALLFYVRQKAFKLKEAVTIFADEAQTKPLYRIAADRVLDISARYNIESADGTIIGAVQRKGMRSLWRAHYEIYRKGALILHIREENPWVKLVDGLIGEIPLVGLATGYILHPRFLVTRASGEQGLRVVKQPAFLEGKYRIEQIAALGADDERLAVIGVLMMLLLERSRG